jgi:hypothetical protein
MEKQNSPLPSIERVSPEEEPIVLPQLIHLLQDTVASGASVGFLPPLNAEDAQQYCSSGWELRQWGHSADLAGLAYVLSGKNYDLLDLAVVQARLLAPHDAEITHPEWQRHTPWVCFLMSLKTLCTKRCPYRSLE